MHMMVHLMVHMMMHLTVSEISVLLSINNLLIQNDDQKIKHGRST